MIECLERNEMMRAKRTMFRFAFRSSPILWLLSAVGALLVQVATPYLPPGERVAFVASIGGRRQLMFSDLTRRISFDLPPFTGDAFQPSASPDGRELVFAADLDGDSELYALRLGDSQPRQLTDNDYEDLHPQWSPDGKSIVYQSNPNGVYQFFLFDAASGTSSQLTFNDAAFGRPSWAPDGKALAYDSAGEIIVYDIASGESRALTQGESWDVQPVWSPVGDTIVYDSYRGGGWNLYKIELASGQISALTDPDRDEQHATFTNQPGQIAFQSVTRFPGRLFLMNIDGSWAVRTVEIPPDAGSPLYLLFGRRDVLDVDWTDILEPDWLRH